MTCLAVYATTQQYAEWWGTWRHKIDLGDLTVDELAALARQLEMAASDINLALAQVGACDYTLSSYGYEFCKKLNILITAVVYNSPCGPRLDAEERSLWMTYINDQLTAIREGKLELCDGETGADYPAWGTAEIGWTEDNVLQIIANRLNRTSP